jgi:hypothetical protein
MGLSYTGINCLLTEYVRGYNREPAPPARIILLRNENSLKFLYSSALSVTSHKYQLNNANNDKSVADLKNISQLTQQLGIFTQLGIHIVYLLV